MPMIDIQDKALTRRLAVVEGIVSLKNEVLEMIRNNKIPKGNVLEIAKVSGILAAKKTSQLLPLCHPIPIEYIDINVDV